MKNKKAKKLINDMWEAMLIPWVNKTIVKRKVKMKKNKEYTLTKAETNYLLSTYIFAIWPEIYNFENSSIKPDIKATIKEELRHFIEEYTPSKVSKYFKDKYYDIEITIKLKEDQKYPTQRYFPPIKGIKQLWWKKVKSNASK